MLSCVWNRVASRSYSIFFPMLNIIIPCIIVLILYSRIFIFMPKWLKYDLKFSQKHVKELLLAKSLFVSFLFFATFWLPYSLIVLVDFGSMLPQNALMFSMAIAHFNSSLNAIIYALYNPDFRRGYANLIRKISALKIIKKSNKIEQYSTKATCSNLNHFYINQTKF